MADEIDGGWVKSYRCTMDHPVWSHHNANRVLQWAIWKANWKIGYYKGREIPRGSFVTGRNAGAEEVGLTPSTFQRALDKLEELGCVTLQADNQKTVVTLCNYTRYQGEDSGQRTADGQRMDSGWTADGQRMDTIEEGKNGKREESNNQSTATPSGDCPGKPAKTPKPKPPAFDPLAVTLPPTIDTPLMRSAWQAWADHRREVRQPLTPRSVDQQVRLLVELGHDRAVELIRTSIRNGWKGLFPNSLPPPPRPHERQHKELPLIEGAHEAFLAAQAKAKAERERGEHQRRSAQ